MTQDAFRVREGSPALMLEESESRLSIALAASHSAMWEWDLQTGCISSSPQVADVLGQRDFADSIDEFFARVHPEDADRVRALALSSIANGETYKAEYRVVKDDGEVSWLRSTARTFYGDDRKPLRMVGTTSDITQEREAQRLLRDATRHAKEQEAELASLLAHLNAAQSQAKLGSWNWIPGESRVWWSEELYRIFEKDRASFSPTTKECGQLFHPDDSPQWLEKIERSLRDGGVVESVLRHVRVDGEIRYCRMRGEPQLEEEGQNVRFLGTVQDVTELARAELEADSLRSQLVQAQKLESLGQLTGGIAHEFNNVLAIIGGFSALARAHVAAGAAAKANQSLEEIESAVTRGADVVKKMLTYSRKHPERKSEAGCFPAVVVGELVSAMNHRLLSNIVLTSSIPTRTFRAAIAKVDLEQVLEALITNAREAMREGGDITISLNERHVSEERCGSCHEPVKGEYISLKVANSGSVIPPGLMTRIFDPFFSTKQPASGKGLGLWVTHGRLHASGAHVVVSTNAVRGMSFEILLRPQELAKL